MPKQYTPAEAAAQTRARIIAHMEQVINRVRLYMEPLPAAHVIGNLTGVITWIESMDERASRTAGGWDKDRGIKNKPRATGKKAPKGQGRG